MHSSLENWLDDDFIAAKSCSLFSASRCIVLSQQANVWFVDNARLIFKKLSYLLDGFQAVQIRHVKVSNDEFESLLKLLVAPLDAV